MAVLTRSRRTAGPQPPGQGPRRGRGRSVPLAAGGVVLVVVCALVFAEGWLRAGDRRDPGAAAKREHRSPQEQFRYENHVRYMIPLDPQLGFLRAAGFEGVDAFWKNLDFVIYGGRRPLA